MIIFIYTGLESGTWIDRYNYLKKEKKRLFSFGKEDKSPPFFHQEYKKQQLKQKQTK